MKPLRTPELIEQEMAGIRSRTAPDLVDLRRQVELQAVKEQVRQSALEYLHGIRNVFVSNSRHRGPLAVLVILGAVAVLVARRASDRNG
jgi:hypothetical protein